MDFSTDFFTPQESGRATNNQTSTSFMRKMMAKDSSLSKRKRASLRNLGLQGARLAFRP